VRGQVRREDTIGRYGGDEFVLLLPNTTEIEAVELAQRLRGTVASTTISPRHDALDVSVGVAQWDRSSSGEALLAAADEALLAAKAAGGAAVVRASALPRG
jgi:diguanylate cyclase (GGDEF)-like protein